MQEDRVRHYGRADDADRQRQRGGVGQDRRRHAADGRAPVDRRDHQLDEVAKADGRDEGADDELDRPEAPALDMQDGERQERDDAHADHHRNMQEQRKSDRSADEFGEIGRHRGEFADAPERVDDRLRQPVAAHLREVPPRHDAELGRQRLKQHRDDIGEQHDPQERVAVSGAGLDVGGEIAGVHVGDRGDHRRTDEQECGKGAAAARQRLLDGGERPLGHRRVGH